MWYPKFCPEGRSDADHEPHPARRRRVETAEKRSRGVFRPDLARFRVAPVRRWSQDVVRHVSRRRQEGARDARYSSEYSEGRGCARASPREYATGAEGYPSHQGSKERGGSSASLALRRCGGSLFSAARRTQHATGDDQGDPADTRPRRKAEVGSAAHYRDFAERRKRPARPDCRGDRAP